ncbi:MAG: HAMP domain-containing histidine kinase [Kaiparowitsia implicata GSE-PSE-MK54-09C]|jgi:signal transduction histidine kinase|nr:HAMP domain-containing histidine kinase [Kaiparowitsia implicata GSE-PSE-MK54-09C]
MLALSRWQRPVSLRTKLLVGFSVVFGVVFAGAFYWFYSFTTDKVLTRLRADMQATLYGALAGLDPELLQALYETGQPNADGFSNDPRYLAVMDWFQMVHSIEPRAWLYTYATGDARYHQRAIAQQVQPNEPITVYLVDIWSAYNPEKAAQFLETTESGSALRRIASGSTLEEFGIYEDEWGTWVSAFVPLPNQGNGLVFGLGLDIEASYVRQIQSTIRQRVLIASALAYSILFGLIYILSGMLTRQLRELTHAADQIATGDYSLGQFAISRGYFPDEMTSLSQVFRGMVQSIRVREQLIREGKRTEDQMRLALEEERELNELKSRFIAMVSHELRTPLTVIRTSIELLDRYGHVASEEKQQHYFQRSRIAIETMNQLIEDVLMIGKAEAKKLDFKPVLLDLRAFCRDVVDEVRLGVGHTHRVAFVHQGDDAEGYFDPKLMRSILTNLLSNAIKYSPTGSTVEFSLTCADRTATLVIRDAGIGIPLDDQPMLFELFHRASNVHTIRGTGLGLAIVRQCVLEHGGDISFVSQEDRGTTFTVQLPLLRHLNLEPFSTVAVESPPSAASNGIEPSEPSEPSTEIEASGHLAPEGSETPNAPDDQPDDQPDDRDKQ